MHKIKFMILQKLLKKALNITEVKVEMVKLKTFFTHLLTKSKFNRVFWVLSLLYHLFEKTNEHSLRFGECR